jgi:hypothetical protein
LFNSLAVSPFFCGEDFGLTKLKLYFGTSFEDTGAYAISSFFFFCFLYEFGVFPRGFLGNGDGFLCGSAGFSFWRVEAIGGTVSEARGDAFCGFGWEGAEDVGVGWA